MAFPVSPAAPVRSAVEADNRITTRLNKAGTEATNIIIGNSRDGSDIGYVDGGFAVELSFGMVDALEQIYGATVTLYDDAGNVVSNHSIIDSWNTSALTLRATAEIIPGIDFPSSDTPRRAIIQVWTSRKRAISGQMWVGNLPVNQVLINGVQTSAAAPLEILIGDVGTEIIFSVQIFPSLNDEVGRQHGADSIALNANVVKPYGGASHVTVIKGITQVYTATPIEQVTTLSHTPTSSGELIQFRFFFTSASGSSQFVRCYAYVRFVVCTTTGGGGSTTTASTSLVCPPSPEPPVILNPDTFDSDPGTIEEDTDGHYVRVNLGSNGDLGEGTNPAQIDLSILAYEGATADVSGTPTETIVQLSTEQSETIPVTEGQTTKVYLPVAIEDADLVVVRPSTVAGDGGALVYRRSTSDVGPANPPMVSSVAYNFTTNQLTFDLDSLGFPGAIVTAHVKPLTGAIGNPGATHQTNDELTVQVSESAQSTTFSTVGSSKSFSPSFSDDPEAVAVYFSNSYGAEIASVSFFRESDAIYSSGVKRRPVISSPSLTTAIAANDTINFTIDDAGANPANMTLHYRIYEAVLGAETPQMPTVQDVGRSTITPTTGAKTTLTQSGHNNIRGRYVLWLEGDQGYSDTVEIDNLSGSVSLP